MRGCAAPESPPFGSRLEDLDWVDTFAGNVRPHVRVRLEDNVLIKVPLETYPINPTGARLLRRALDGEKIRSIALSAGAERCPERIAQIHAFFCDVRDLLSRRLGDAAKRLATSVTPFTGSVTKYPVLSEIALTYRCNLACRFCYAGCGEGRPAAEPGNSEMTTEEVLTVIDRVALDGKVPSVSFTGGEPTLRSDLPEFIARAKSREMRVNLITNGLACASKDLVRQLAEAGLASAQVSLEGPTAEVHDALTRGPGAFNRALEGIRNLRDAGLHVHTNTTVCGGNAEDLNGIIDLAKSLGLARVSMNMIIPTGTPAQPPHQSLQISYSRIGEYVLRTRDHADRRRIAFLWYSPIPMCVFNPIAHGLGQKGCAACDGLVHVSPSGDVLPCSSFTEGVGNLLRDGFEAVWFGEPAQHYKKKQMAHAVCRECEHFALCQGACVLYWRTVGYEELFQAVRRRRARAAYSKGERTDAVPAVA